MARSIVTDAPRVILQNPPWMSRPWRIRSSSDPLLGVAPHPDILLFTTAGKITVLKNGDTQTQKDWAKSCQLTAGGGLSGLTSDNKPFLIQYNSSTKHLTCHIPPLEVGTSAKMPGPGATWVAEEGGSGGPGSGGPPLPKNPGPSRD
ncbi:MAG: hypothetical protein QOF89_5443 [Acidobacteriota bacterium]|jgi:hypothetical protein|nr:hypothetical protein [Acidobacteriota bacterium]